MKTCLSIALVAGSLALAGCGQSGDAAKTGERADAKGAAPADWNAADACAMVDKAKMAKTAGKPVAEASLGLVHVSSGGGDATTSECSYIMEDGSRATVLLRWSPISDNTPEAMALTLKTTKESSEAFGATVEPVEGLGKSAFWTAKIDSLGVFIGDDKFAVITLPSSPSSKEQALALARDLGA
ncbi:hypothetical protein L7H23_01700 [Sphingopyxis sp. BSN-002]|uniref:hypothetical protein n=1 Tax=Sphingopyxis sp. BSN-002 TaxID=2911495 RepID=UPI001EDB143A|nr:hypothetical protein [Sphingopyxis sp. BSN-002]UKK84845.1 hypothetical protein L7H23_01700 [Sphingopyxis sp. BSN-002]